MAKLNPAQFNHRMARVKKQTTVRNFQARRNQRYKAVTEFEYWRIPEHTSSFRLEESQQKSDW
jgi:hypothetical protein